MSNTHIVEQYKNEDKILQLEQERQTTMASKEFQQWYKQFNVSRLHIDRTLVHNANTLMRQWDRPDIWSKLFQ